MINIKLHGGTVATGITSAFDALDPPEPVAFNNVLLIGEGNPGKYRVRLSLFGLNGSDDTATPEPAVTLFNLRVDAYDPTGNPLIERPSSENGEGFQWVAVSLGKPDTTNPFGIPVPPSSTLEAVLTLYRSERLTYNLGTSDPLNFHGGWTAYAELEIEQID